MTELAKRYNVFVDINFDDWEKVQKSKYSDVRKYFSSFEPINSSTIRIYLFVPKLAKSAPDETFKFRLWIYLEASVNDIIADKPVRYNNMLLFSDSNS